jgi:tetratricopeptide (TPR) repeat protein
MLSGPGSYPLRAAAGAESSAVLKRSFVPLLLLFLFTLLPTGTAEGGPSDFSPPGHIAAALERKAQIQRLIPEFDPYSPDEEVDPATLTLAVRRCSRLASAESLAQNPFLYCAAGEALRRLDRHQEAAQRYLLAYSRAGQDLETHLLLAVLYEERGLGTLASTEFDRILELGRERGATSLPLISDFLLRKGWDAYLARQCDAAGHYFEQAALFDPAAYHAHLALARLHLSRANPDALTDMIAALRAVLRDFDNQLGIATDLYHHGTFIFSIVAAVVLLVIALQHLPLTHHLLTERYPRSMPSWLRSGSSWVILLLPVAWGIHPIWLGLLGSALSWVYLSRKEKAVVLVLVVALLATPLLASLGNSLGTALDPNGEAALISRAQKSPWDPTLLEKLRTYTRGDESSSEFLASVALLSKRGGRFAEARDDLERAIARDEMNAMLHNNLGNVYFALGELNHAIVEYETAKRLNPRSAATYFNLGHLYLHDLRLAESSAALKAASELDLELVNRYVGTGSKSINSQLIDEQIRPLRLWRIAIHRWYLHPASFPVPNPPGAAPLRAAGLSLAALLAIGLVRRRAKSMARHPRCTACGRPICSKCRHIEGINAYCHECNSRGLHTSSATVRMRVMEGIWRRRMRKAKIMATLLTALFPGSGHIYIGSWWRGILFLALWTSLASLWWYRARLVPVGSIVPSPPSLFMMAVPILFAILIYAAALRSVLARITVYARHQAVHRQKMEIENGPAG